MLLMDIPFDQASENKCENWNLDTTLPGFLNI